MNPLFEERATLVPLEPLSDLAETLATDARFRLIFEATFQFIGLMDARGTLLEVNRPALAWVRSPREAAIGRPVWETPWWVNAGNEVLDRLKAAVAVAGRGEFVRYDVALPSPDGQKHTFDFSLTPIADESGRVVLLVAEGRDITEQKRLEEALREANRQLEVAQEQARQLAITDPLTGLYNRRGFFVVGEQHKRAALRTGATGLLVFADIDHLKFANDRYGHDCGDALITGAAAVLTQTFRANDLVARIGGDEFAVIATVGAGESPGTFTARLAARLAAFNAGRGGPAKLQMSVGTHDFEWCENLQLETLLARADTAMYAERRNRKRIPLEGDKP